MLTRDYARLETLIRVAQRRLSALDRNFDHVSMRSQAAAWVVGLVGELFHEQRQVAAREPPLERCGALLIATLEGEQSLLRTGWWVRWRCRRGSPSERHDLFWPLREDLRNAAVMVNPQPGTGAEATDDLLDSLIVVRQPALVDRLMVRDSISQGLKPVKVVVQIPS